jgi:hypothetical protein
LSADGWLSAALSFIRIAGESYGSLTQKLPVCEEIALSLDLLLGVQFVGKGPRGLTALKEDGLFSIYR